MKGIFLLLGSNLGKRHQNLINARDKIAEFLGDVIGTSKVYQTEAWGKEDQPDFLNQVVQIKTSIDPQLLMKKILGIEGSMGRKRSKKWGARIIDIDILLYDDKIIKTADLTIPHPEIKNRLFTLVPLGDLVGNQKFPGEEYTINDLIRICPDELNVEEYEI